MNRGKTLDKSSGFVLLIALIALVLITLAAVGLVRTVDSAVSISGNLAFKNASVQSADVAVNEAVKWLLSKSGSGLNENIPADGYYAMVTDLDITGQKTSSVEDDIDWFNKADKLTYKAKVVNGGVADEETGYSYRYIITRLCEIAGDINAPGNTCLSMEALAAKEGSSHGVKNIGEGVLTNSFQTYYRIVVRIDGPKETSSFVETVVVR